MKTIILASIFILTLSCHGYASVRPPLKNSMRRLYALQKCHSKKIINTKKSINIPTQIQYNNPSVCALWIRKFLGLDYITEQLNRTTASLDNTATKEDLVDALNKKNHKNKIEKHNLSIKIHKQKPCTVMKQCRVF